MTVPRITRGNLRKSFPAVCRLLPAVLLMLVLGSCQPLDPNPNRLPGTWERVYPENDPLNLYETWTFGNDGKLFIHSEGPSATFDIPYQYSVNSDGEEPMLKTNRLMGPATKQPSSSSRSIRLFLFTVSRFHPK
ncbi:MAG: hypothetical protein J5702_08305 [Bacteroidales bacterium]|nr:hypothetical protein [Bacteroidales bacterium]